MTNIGTVTVAGHYLADTIVQLNKVKELAEKALAQIDDAQMFVCMDPESNSIAIIMKHVAGNMRSRWTDFLTTDGEKPDRQRDREFENEAGESSVRIRMLWDDGWRRTFGAIEGLNESDLLRTVYIGGKPHTVMEAINRQVSHYSQHVGQILFIAKHLKGESWQSLSVPRAPRSAG
jgi:hypothetical protein